MTSQATSIAERLFEAESPCDLQDWENKAGYYIATCRVSKEDVPGLVDIASKWSDPDWSGDDLGLDADLDDIEMLPVTAWRTLADLKSSEAVEPLVYMLTNLDDELDDWACDELPHVFGKIGKPALGAMVQLADDADQPGFLRTIAAAALHRIAEYHTETRDDIVATLAQMLTKADRSNIEFNSILLVGLVELRAAEAAEAIERAFAGDCLDVGMMGDWEDVRRRLGVEGLGLQMPERPQDSIEQLRRRIGIGIFSDRPIYDEGEVDPDAEQAYYARAWDAFAPSQEAKRFFDRFGDPGWFQMLLEFGLHYHGEIIDEITLGGVDEFLFEYVPRKVSTEPERATEIVLELTLFWEYLQRVYELPNAKSIIEWLKTDGTVARLQAEMSNPANFGMAKSILMSGKAAGYDMTSENGTAEFMAAYNRSLRPTVESAPAPVVSGREKIGRNDPCPCGSGKKFKKCCRQAT